MTERSVPMLPDGYEAKGCWCCGTVQAVPEHVPRGERRSCVRCGVTLRAYRPFHCSNTWTLAFVLAAIIVLPFGLLLPIMSIEQMGRVNEASILEGVESLYHHGNFFVATVVLVCSVIFPILKNGGLLMLLFGRSVLPDWVLSRVYRFVEFSGRWGMLDVMLVTILIAVLKLKDFVSVTSGSGLIAFTISVIFSIAASIVFDEHNLWKKQKGDSYE